MEDILLEVVMVVEEGEWEVERQEGGSWGVAARRRVVE